MPNTLTPRIRRWTWLAALAALAACGTILWAYFQQRAALAEAEAELAQLRQARIDLAKGFLALAFSQDSRDPTREEPAVTVLTQAIHALEQLAARSSLATLRGQNELPLAELPRTTAEFNRLLADWRAAPPGQRREMELTLRVVHHNLERMAQQLDAARQHDLRTKAAFADRRFVFTLTTVIGLLGVLWTYVYLAGRSQQAGVAVMRESEARLRLVGDNLPESYLYQYQHDDTGQPRFSFISAGVERIHQVTAAQVLREPETLLAQLDAEQRALLQASESQSMKTLADFRLDIDVRRPDGTHRRLTLLSRPSRDAGGRVQWHGLAMDVTAKRAAEDTLRQREAWLRELSAMAHVGGWEWEVATGMVSWTEEAAHIFELSAAEPVDRQSLLALFIAESRLRLEKSLAAAVERNQPCDLELEVVTRSGRRKWVHTQGFPVIREQRVSRLRGWMQDITQRKEAEAAVRTSEARFRALFEQAGDGIFIFDAEGRYEDVNARGLQLLGYTREELLGRPAGDLSPGESAPRILDFVARLKRGETVTADWQVRRRDDALVEVEFVARRLSDGRGICIMRDRTERLAGAARAALHHAVTLLLAESAPFPSTVQRIVERIASAQHWDFGAVWLPEAADGRLHCSTHWVSPQASCDPLVALLPQATRAAGEGFVGAVWSKGAPLWLEQSATSAADALDRTACECGLVEAIGLPLLVRGEVSGVIEFRSHHCQGPDSQLLALLATLGTQLGQFMERQDLQQQFQEAQKMEAIGTLAGGIAHDFNNILSGIICYTSLAQMSAGENREVQEYLEQVARAGARAADLVRQILAFSRQGEQKRAILQLRHIVAESVKLLRATIPATIEFHTRLPADLPTVSADATQMHQIMMNLGTNAWHAMRTTPNARLDIEAAAVDLDVALAGALRLKPGAYIRVSVRDNGHGMDAATQKRIFDPFFTTKPRGEGTGLGLPVVRGIVESHGGAIAVESELGVGTVFRVYLPVSQGAPHAAEPPHEALPQGHGERIFVVDDEDAVAFSTSMLLKRNRFSVETFASPAEALTRLQQPGTKCDLLITDHTLPVFTGLELARQVHALRPSLPIVLTTGYSAELPSEEIASAGIVALLPKPANAAQLLHVVERALARAVPPP